MKLAATKMQTCSIVGLIVGSLRRRQLRSLLITTQREGSKESHFTARTVCKLMHMAEQAAFCNISKIESRNVPAVLASLSKIADEDEIWGQIPSDRYCITSKSD